MTAKKSRAKPGARPIINQNVADWRVKHKLEAGPDPLQPLAAPLLREKIVSASKGQSLKLFNPIRFPRS